MKASNAKKGQSLSFALDQMSYEYFAINAPNLIVAIDDELQNGTLPEGVKFIVQSHVGPDREGLAMRCEQAARYMAKRKVAAE